MEWGTGRWAFLLLFFIAESVCAAITFAPVSTTPHYYVPTTTMVSVGGFALAGATGSETLTIEVETSGNGNIQSFNPTATTYTITGGGPLPSNDVTISDTATPLLVAINNFVYTPRTSPYTGPVNLVLVLYSGVQSSDSPDPTSLLDVISVQLIFAPTNAAPVVTMTPTTLSAINGNGFVVTSRLTFSSSTSPTLVITDDSGASDVERLTLKLTQGQGTMALNAVSGLVYLQGTSGMSNTSIIVNATVPTMNSALDGFTFTPAPYFWGPVSLSFEINDYGHTGPGGIAVGRFNISFMVSHTALPPYITSASPFQCTVNSNCSWTFTVVDPQNAGTVQDTIYNFLIVDSENR